MARNATPSPPQDLEPCAHSVVRTTRGMPGYNHGPGRPPKWFDEDEHETIIGAIDEGIGLTVLTRVLNEDREAKFGPGFPTVSIWRVRYEVLALGYYFTDEGQWIFGERPS